MSAENLREVILELYDARPEAKEYLEYWVDPDIEKEMEKYQKKIHKIFFISDEKPRKSPDFAEANKLVKYFATLCFEQEKLIELRLYYSEQYAEWMRHRRLVMSQETRATKLLNETYDMIISKALEDTYGIRYDKVTALTSAIFERGDLPTRRGWGRYLSW